VIVCLLKQLINSVGSSIASVIDARHAFVTFYFFNSYRDFRSSLQRLALVVNSKTVVKRGKLFRD